MFVTFIFENFGWFFKRVKFMGIGDMILEFGSCWRLELDGSYL